MNQCGACGEDFGSVNLFDRHRVGKHAYLYSEGLKMDPPLEDGRRCLSVKEMLQRGWSVGKRGRWEDPVESSRAAHAFAPTVPQLGDDQ